MNNITPEITEKLIAHMESRGWKCDINTDEKLRFVFPGKEKKQWIRDYDKKTGRYIQFNGNQKVNLIFNKQE
jgi:hypothetical protein